LKSLEFSTASGTKQIPSRKISPISSTKIDGGIAGAKTGFFASFTKNKSTETSSNSDIKLSGRKRLLFYIGALVIVPILIISIGLYAFLSFSALYTVNITYEYKNITASKQIIASTGTSTDFSVVKLEETDAVSSFQNTTGQKVNGERARGRITVFNATSEIKTFPKGTTITCVSAACNGLVYTSVNDLNLGPGSSVNDYEIIASDIGENYNLATSAGRFKIAKFDSTTEITSSNIAPIAGGTPKVTVKVISAADIQSVEARAVEDLKVILVNKIKSNPTYNSQYIISDNSIVVEKISAETDKEGTESEVVNTSVRAKGTVDAFPKEQIQKVIDELKTSFVPVGYYLDEKTFAPTNNVISSTPGQITIEVTVSGIARIKVDEAELKKELAGQSLDEADKILALIPNSKSFTTEYTPSTMPSFLRRVPSDPERIQVRFISLAPSE
jgi:ribosomal protein S8E